MHDLRLDVLTSMPRRTNPLQPVIYDMMLLADALVALRHYAPVRQREPQFCERQKNLETALSKIRSLAQFMSGTGGKDLIKVTDAEFGGTADRSFIKGHFDTISRYVSHLHEQRWKKEAKYPRPTAGIAMAAGKTLLKAVMAVIKPHESKLSGDAAHWYSVLLQRCTDLGLDVAHGRTVCAPDRGHRAQN